MGRLRMLGLMLCVVLATGSARAHFVWVALETRNGSDSQVQVYFGELAEPDSAKFLERLTRLKAWHRTVSGDYATLKLSKTEASGGGWFEGQPPAALGTIEADCLYGVFSHGDKALLLHCYAKWLRSDASDSLRRSDKLDLDVVPQVADGQMSLGVYWKGQPVDGSQIMVSPPEGEPMELKTDASGLARLKTALPGRYEIRARRVEKKSGEFQSEKYGEVAHYSTLTLDVVEAGAGKISSTTPSRSGTGTPYIDLPRGITSFGAAVIGDWLYVYGGHFGRPHHYSNTSQSDELSRLNLSRPAAWETIAKGPRLQGLAMVAHGGKLYRVGGFTAHNQEDADHDLRSVADFVRFDPKMEQWESLASLPEPRSSHDAVVIGDKLYVAGGWHLGGEDPKWHQTAWVTDLSQEKIVWEPLPEPPFQRRAVSLGHLKRQTACHWRHAAERRSHHSGGRLRSSQRPVVPGAQPDRSQSRRRPRQGDGRLRFLGLHGRRSPFRQHLRRQCPGSRQRSPCLAYLDQVGRRPVLSPYAAVQRPLAARGWGKHAFGQAPSL